MQLLFFERTHASIIFTSCSSIIYLCSKGAFLYLCIELLFYLFHYSLHKYFYNFHKEHHKLIKKESLLGIGALNMDFVEFFVTITIFPLLFLSVDIGISNVPFIGTVNAFTQSKITAAVPAVLIVHVMLIVVITFTLVDSHSNNPLLNSIEHNIHHTKRDINYGFGLYIFDRLFGTYSNSTHHIF